MERVDKLISTFIKRRYGLSLTRVYAKLRSGLLQDLQPVRCNLCDTDASVEIAHRDKYDLALTTVMCRNCGLIYLNPRPSAASYDNFYFEGGSKEGVYHMSLGLDHVEAFLRRYYGADFRMTDTELGELRTFLRVKYSEHIGKNPDGLTDEELLEALEAKAREFEAWRYEVYAEEIYRHFRDFVPSSGKVFEVGAAWGKLLVPWRDRHGCQVSGLEPRKATVRAAKERLGIDLIQGLPATADVPENTYDAVFNVRTINHMLDPLGDLRHAWRWLKPGGVMIIDISDAIREAGYEGFENNVIEIDHTYMFSSNTLTAMMQRAGFEVIKCDIVDTRHVWWGERREPEYKQIRIVGRKSLDPVPVTWPDPLQELANLLRAQLGRETTLLTRQTGKTGKSKKTKAKEGKERDRKQGQEDRLKEKEERREKKREERRKQAKEKQAGLVGDARSVARGMRRMVRRLWSKRADQRQ